MTHTAITEVLNGKSADWMEQVADAQYLVPPVPVAAVLPPAQGQKLFGDIAPKFAQLTDEVLFGDVWARPGLSQRDRSLITVSALIAMNRPDQLRGHMARARQNGVSDAELIEAYPSGVLCRLAQCSDGDRSCPRSHGHSKALMPAGKSHMTHAPEATSC